VAVVSRYVGKIKLDGQTLIDLNAIEQYLHVLTWQTAQENRSQLAGGSGLNDRQPGDFPQRVAYAFDLFLPEIVRANYTHAGGRLIERNVETRCRDNYLFNLRFAGRRSRRGLLGQASGRKKSEDHRKFDWGARASRILASASRDGGLFSCITRLRDSRVEKRSFRRDAETNIRN